LRATKDPSDFVQKWNLLAESYRSAGFVFILLVAPSMWSIGGGVEISR
jgi:hypothetical protein